MTDKLVTIEYVREFRLADWDRDVPTREGWKVTCQEHGQLGRPAGWCYSSPGIASGVATKHLKRHTGRSR